MPKNLPHIVVFFGGTSGSHDLSQETGYWVCNYIPRSKYRVTPVRITTDGQWQVPLGGLPQQGPIDRMVEMLFANVRPVSPTEGLQRLLRHPVRSLMTTLRGKGGDDGAFHTLGATLQIPVVGSDSHTCQQTSLKHVCAQRVEDLVTTPYSLYFRATTPDETIADAVRAVFQPPFFIKPATEEGSVGVQEVHNMDELLPAIRHTKARGDVIVQERLPGTEMTVTVLEDAQGHITVLPPTIVVPNKISFYDHLAKRRAGRVTLHTPDPTTNRIVAQVQNIARDVYQQLGCQGYASLDFIANNDDIDLLEVNTIPTLTTLTPLRHQLKAAQLHPTKMIDDLIAPTLR